MRDLSAGVLLMSLAACCLPAAADDRPPFDDGKASFVLRVGEEAVPYRVMAVSILPSRALTVEVVAPLDGVDYEASVEDGVLEQPGPARWTWVAPEQTGLHPLTVRREDTGDFITLQVFVLVPLERVKDGYLEGYRIGRHPDVALRGLAVYEPPPGLIRVTPDLLDTQVSPHFLLRHFLCKQKGGFPKFLALRSKLLLKLEFLLQEVNAAGYRTDTFAILSGYRTPFYNRSIGNVKYSRHVWGGAADIFVDESPRDGMMDDLNKDGTIDWQDAAVLYELVDGLYERREYKRFVGGLGRYKKTASHGPFVHVDVRGFRARWGT